MKPLLEETHGLLQVSKLEGDAIFMYDLPEESQHCRKMFYEALEILPRIFERKQSFLVQANICKCQACINISTLSLKVIVHSGEALINELKGFQELSGIDVIIVHRLLKNDYPSKKYLLLTKSSCEELKSIENEGFEDYLYEDPDLGKVESRVLNYEKQKNTIYVKVSSFGKLKHEFWKFSSTLLAFLRLKKIENLD
jgi:hypothetical protein